jgi:hypothetical protein
MGGIALCFFDLAVDNVHRRCRVCVFCSQSERLGDGCASVDAQNRGFYCGLERGGGDGLKLFPFRKLSSSMYEIP